jgi:hypothetical protein
MLHGMKFGKGKPKLMFGPKPTVTENPESEQQNLDIKLPMLIFETM